MAVHIHEWMMYIYSSNKKKKKLNGKNWNSGRNFSFMMMMMMMFYFNTNNTQIYNVHIVCVCVYISHGAISIKHLYYSLTCVCGWLFTYTHTYIPFYVQNSKKRKHIIFGIERNDCNQPMKNKYIKMMMMMIKRKKLGAIL